MASSWRNIRVVFLLQVAIVCLVVVLCMLGLDAANGEVVQPVTIAAIGIALLAIAAVTWMTYRATKRLLAPMDWLLREVARWDPQRPDTRALAPERIPYAVQGEVRMMADALHGPAFRAYTGNDMVGAELGGAMKNVLAVATGVADGMELGLNARAGLITRGLNEMLRLAAAIGARPETLMGLAGLGDLVLTCTGDLSRNRRLGLALGRGQTLDDAVREIGQVVESVQTADEVMRLAARHGVELPIAGNVRDVLHGDLTPAEGLSRLMAREQKAEYPQELFP